MTNFQKVKTFMQTFGQEVKLKPSFSTQKINDLRYNSKADYVNREIKIMYSDSF